MFKNGLFDAVVSLQAVCKNAQNEYTYLEWSFPTQQLNQQNPNERQNKDVGKNSVIAFFHEGIFDGPF